MGFLSPTDALTTCEQALRELYAAAYTTAFGETWLTRISTEEQRARWREKRDVEEKRRTTRGAAAMPQDELAYAEFYELCDIAEKNWEPLAAALGHKKRTLALLRRFEDLRNTVAHSRPVLPFEADLLSGIAGEVRNRVTIYMSETDTSGNVFARIDSVTDSFGNAVVPGRGEADVCHTELVLRAGDVVRFSCRGTDPHDRAIRWELSPEPGSARFTADGADAELEWQVTDDNVAERTLAGIRLIADSPHHRLKGAYDGLVVFVYRVLPRDAA